MEWTFFLSSMFLIVNLPSSSQLDESNREVVLKLHNNSRSSVMPPASNMKSLVYSTVLENAARSNAQQCSFHHSDEGDDDVGDEDKPVGYNTYYLTGYYEDSYTKEQLLERAVMQWLSERKYYSYAANKCVYPPCKFYRQLVWANSERVGCAVKFCNNFEIYPDGVEEAMVVVCAYGPGGNMAGEKPYALVEYTPKEPPQLEPSASASNSLSLELASMIMTTTIPVISPTPTPGPINNDVAVEVDTPPVSLDEIVPTRKLSPCPYPAGLNEILKNIPKGKSVFWERLFISDGGKVLEC